MGPEQTCQSAAPLAAALLPIAGVTAFSAWSWIGIAFTGLSALVWLGLSIPMILGQRRMRGLGSAPPLPDAAAPRVSVVCAARDERARVEQAARSLLAQEYPGLEIVYVDDRSQDGTGGILDRLAAENPRLHVLHVAELPDGWLGKCHALARGAEIATGDWILFTDGDVHLKPDAVRHAVSLARELGADHLAVGADLEFHTLGERIFIAYFSALFFASQKPWEAPDPKSNAHVGIGAFNFVRREAYDRAGGHAALRMEVVDDMALGLIVKKAGGRSHLAFHDGYVSVRWNEGVGGLVRGVEKNAFAAMRYRVGETVVAVAFQFLGTWAPVLGWFLPGPWPKVFAAAGWIGLAILYRAIARNMRLAWWDFLLAPIGAALFSYAIVRSMVLTLSRRGVVWRETHYGIEELRRGRVR